MPTSMNRAHFYHLREKSMPLGIMNSSACLYACLKALESYLKIWTRTMSSYNEPTGTRCCSSLTPSLPSHWAGCTVHAYEVGWDRKWLLTRGGEPRREQRGTHLASMPLGRPDERVKPGTRVYPFKASPGKGPS